MAVDGASSEVRPVNIGVPQGSTLGPLLFITYINDLHLIAHHCKVVHFADDTTLYHSNTDFNSAVRSINSDLLGIQEWLQCNRLSINVLKTNYMIITNRAIPADCLVKFGDNILTPVDSAKFLGVTIDNRLNFSTHAQHIKTRVARGIGVMKKFSHLVPRTTLRSLYFSLVYSHVMYALPVWGNSGKMNFDKIASILDKAIDVISNHTFTAANPVQSNVLNYDKSLKYSNLIHFHKIVHNLDQQYFHQILQNNQVNHRYPTSFHNNFNFLPPFFTKSKCQNSFLFRATNDWNDLPLDLTNIRSPSKFKKKLKRFLLSM